MSSSGKFLLAPAFSYVIFSLLRLLACIVSFEQSLCHVASSSAVSLPNKKTSHVKFRIHFKICAITFRALKENQPTYLADLLVRPKCSTDLRSTNSNRFVVPRIKTKTGLRAFSMSGPALWNALLVPIRNAKTILTFRKLLKSHLFDLAFPP